MRVLLVFPGLDFEVAYPLGLASVAAALLGEGHEVHGVDVALDGLAGLEAALGRVRPEVVGMALWSPNLPQARAAAEAIHSGSEARLLLGGPQASLSPEQSLIELDADAVVVGEGEQTAVEVLAAWQRGEQPAGVAGCWWRSEGQVHREPARPLADLDSLPMADRTVFDPRRYPHTWAARAPHAAPVVTSRGCPLACAHCPTPAIHHRRWRARSAAAVVAEIAALPNYIGHVLIEDEHPTVDRQRWLALCAALEAADLGRSWSCPNGLRAETLDRDVIAAMARAGCTRVALGVEATDPAMLKRLGRGDLCSARAATALAREHGIDVTAYFMLGLPGERITEPLHQLREAARMGVSGAHFSLFSPLLGAELDGPAPRGLGAVRAALYAGFYGHPGRLIRALRASHASVEDLPAAARRLSGWLRYGRRPGVGS